MASAEKFRIDLGSGAVSGVLHLPDSGESSAPFAAVLICQGVHIAGEDAGELLDAISSSMTESGVAAVRFEHRCSDLILEDFDAHSVEHDLGDALAVHAWLVQRSEIDKVRIGALGYSLGAIAASALARRLESINRVCLLSPATAQFLRERFGSRDGESVAENSPRLPASYLPSLEEVDSPREAAFYNRPTLVVQGAADRFIDPAVSLEYVRALELAGRNVQHVLVARGDHTFSSPAAREACLARMTQFLSSMEVVATATI